MARAGVKLLYNYFSLIKCNYNKNKWVLNKATSGALTKIHVYFC